MKNRTKISFVITCLTILMVIIYIIIRFPEIINVIPAIHSNATNHSSNIFEYIIQIMSFILAVVPIYVFEIIMLKKRRINNKLNGLKLARLSQKQVYKVDSSLNIDEFKFLVFELFKKLQIAYMNFDYQKIKECTSDELYSECNVLLNQLKLKNEKNIMEDFVGVEFLISDISMFKNIEKVSVVLITNYYDYIVNSNNEIVSGSNKIKKEYVYKLTLVRSLTGYCMDCDYTPNINNLIDCPKCGSHIASGDWVISRREIFLQKNKFVKFYYKK